MWDSGLGYCFESLRARRYPVWIMTLIRIATTETAAADREEAMNTGVEASVGSGPI